MSWINYRILRLILFQIDPELSHNIALSIMRVLGNLPMLNTRILKSFYLDDSRLSQKVGDLNFRNPVGLAAGFDKNACAINSLASIGFGFVEAGAITVKPQKGNAKPRLFRFSESESIQNAMGFNNSGMENISKRLTANFPYKVPIGLNIGKNKNTDPEKSLDEYLLLIDRLHKLCDYIVINLSSPNTPGLRKLENKKFISDLFSAASKYKSIPIFLKVSPDLEIETIISLSAAAVETGAAGIIATNTTIDYKLCPRARTVGGLSGGVLKKKSFEVFQAIAKELYKHTTLISVGGIDSGKEAYKRIKAGASLIQIYTAIVFKGPGLIKEINLQLLELLDRDGFNNISEAIGVERV